MKKTTVQVFAVAFVVWLSFAGQSGAYSAVEHFDYPNGTLLQGQVGGTGWTGGWTTNVNGSFVVTNVNLTYPGIVTAGGSLVLSNLGTATWTIYRNLEESFSGTDVFYVGFLAQKLSADEPSRYFGVSLFATNTEMMLIGQGTGTSDWNVNRVVVPTGGGTPPISCTPRSVPPFCPTFC